MTQMHLRQHRRRPWIAATQSNHAKNTPKTKKQNEETQICQGHFWVFCWKCRMNKYNFPEVPTTPVLLDSEIEHMFLQSPRKTENIKSFLHFLLQDRCMQYLDKSQQCNDARTLMRLLDESMLEMLKKMATPFGDWNTLLVAWKQSMPDLERRLMNLHRYSKPSGGKRKTRKNCKSRKNRSRR